MPDLLIAAFAELADLTVLHLDKEFDLIAEITGQPMDGSPYTSSSEPPTVHELRL